MIYNYLIVCLSSIKSWFSRLALGFASKSMKKKSSRRAPKVLPQAESRQAVGLAAVGSTGIWGCVDIVCMPFDASSYDSKVLLVGIAQRVFNAIL